METQTIRMESAKREGTVPICAIYAMLGVNPTTPGAADSIRKASLRMVNFLQRSPAYVAAIVRAGRAAEKYDHLTSAQSQ